MKKFYVVLFLFFYTHTAQGQNYKVFPTANASWIFEIWVDPGILLSQITYELTGDTLIDGNAYSKLSSQSKSFYPTQGMTDEIYIGAIRYHENKLLFHPPDSTRELILFDFAVQAGDTVYHAFNGVGFWDIPILSIDTVEINGNLHKRWNSHCDSWIEGIGGVWLWLDGNRSEVSCFFQSKALSCFIRNGENYYGDCPNEVSYQPVFVNEDNMWHEQSCCLNSSGNACKQIRYTFQDTVQENGKVYRRLYQSFAPNYDTFEFADALYREDSIGKVYRLDLIANEEIMIYDFSLKLNDTIRLGNEIYFVMKVIAIDSIDLNSGVKRKRMTMKFVAFGNENEYNTTEDGAEVFWIEGIGSLLSPMNTFYMFPIVQCSYDLACYHYQGILEYETARCDLRTATNEVKLLSNVRIFPNPFTNEIFIETKTADNYTIRLYDAFGKLIKDQNFSGFIAKINTSELPAGTYYIQIINNNGTYKTDKVLKIK